MEWKAFFGTAAIAVLIIWFQWPKMKKNPIKDKGVFLALLAIGLLLSLFDLWNMAGPISLETLLFKPFEKLMDNK